MTWWKLSAAGLALVGVTAGAAFAVPHLTATPTADSPADRATQSATAFLDRYVDATGRVVRKDQGGDTVSEGQGYAMLIAAALGDRRRFDLLWSWTRTNLQRPDRLFSWHWNAGVLDPSPAADADLDIARALVIGGRRFGDSSLVQQGTAVGDAALRLETTSLGKDRVLLPGPWASRTPPLLVNPSYFSPGATRVLYRATGDARWLALERGTRRVVQQVSASALPPDWAQVAADGTARASSGPSGEPAGFGWEAVRVPIHLAESCVSADRSLAASMSDRLAAVTGPVADSAVMWSARGMADSAGRRGALAAHDWEQSAQVRSRYPTYYSDAWDALSRAQSLDGRLGGCPTGVVA